MSTLHSLETNMARRKYTRRKKAAKPKKVARVVKKEVKIKEPPFIYGKIISKGRIVHQYAPNEILNKFYFDKFGIMIEATSLKEAKEKVRKMFK